MSNTEKNKSIEEKLDSVFKQRVEKKKKILLSILDVILTQGRRNIPLRGSYDVKIHRKDMWKFKYFIEWKAESFKQLRQECWLSVITNSK